MASRGIWLPWFRGDNALFLTLGLFFFSLILGLPVGFALMALQGISEIIKRIAALEHVIEMDFKYEKPLQ